MYICIYICIYIYTHIHLIHLHIDGFMMIHSYQPSPYPSGDEVVLEMEAGFWPGPVGKDWDLHHETWWKTGDIVAISSGYVKIAIEDGPVEIVDLPIEMVIFQSYVSFAEGISMDGFREFLTWLPPGTV